MTVSKYISENYKPGEPIFSSDIKIESLSSVALRQQLKNLCDSKKILRYAKGIYYIPKKSHLKNIEHIGLSFSEVAHKKYISRNNATFGYYSGHTFANQIGISLQVPVCAEITTNNTAAKKKDVYFEKAKFIIRKPRATITNDNVRILQLLDLLSDIGEYGDEHFDYNDPCTGGRIVEFVKKNKITRSGIDKYIGLYPLSVYKYFYKLRLDNVLA